MARAVLLAAVVALRALAVPPAVAMGVPPEAAVAQAVPLAAVVAALRALAVPLAAAAQAQLPVLAAREARQVAPRWPRPPLAVLATRDRIWRNALSDPLAERPP